MSAERDPGVAPRVLVVVAHPDDETFGCGSIILHARERGAEVTVCCATRGEAGTPSPGSGVAPESLPAVREGELRAAAALLGVAQVELLGYRDSDMGGDPAPQALVAAPLDAVAERIAEVVDRVRPQVVVTLDGSDGHRDHVHIRDATLAAVDRAAWTVERVYLHCIPRSLLHRWADHMRAIAPDSPYLDVEAAGLGTPDEDVTVHIDVAHHLALRRAAIALHASQTSPFAALPAELEQTFLATDALRRVVPPGGPDEPEHELFPDSRPAP